jgi:tRNA pseudouridine13 synthase
MNLPYATAEIPGVGGAIKQRPEDFFVQELPLYEPSGEGEHVYTEIQKIGIPTFEVIDRLSAALNIHPRDIGYAGLKDASAVTRQIFSIMGTTEQAVMDLRLPGMTVQWAARHGNKLRLGHLKANRFAIKIRDVMPTDVIKLKPIVERLIGKGMPNYFGEQRFGHRGNNDQLGAAMIRGDDAGVLKLLLGTPDPKTDEPRQRGAREAFDRNDLQGALKLWPRTSGMERRILARFIKAKKASAVVRMVDERVRRLWVSALQSKLFNEAVARRINSLDRLLDGDLAEKLENGAVFRVESAEIEQPRADAFEISPTGPLLGYRMTLPEKDSLKMEQEIFAAHGLDPADFRVAGRHKIKGARRAIRVKPEDVEYSAGVDQFGSHITVAMTLPAGSFATVFLRELMKNDHERT